jgi:endonuclease/exonuclease/phosphatase family metal-dependent hydrolase
MHTASNAILRAVVEAGGTKLIADVIFRSDRVSHLLRRRLGECGQQGHGMKIVSLNGWGGKLADDLLPYLQAETPDVLCLQEVVHSPGMDESWLTYRDGDDVLPQRANFFHDVCSFLPHRVATFCPAARGVLWQGDTKVPSFWGLATFVHRSLCLIAQAQGFVHGQFSPHGYGDHPRSRSAHAVRLYDAARDGTVGITQMHGLRDLAGKADTPARADQARRLLALSDQIADPSDIRIICGDFNVEPGSETLSILVVGGFQDLVTTRGFDGTRTSHYTKPGRHADYMLANRPEAVVSFDVVRAPEVSDHCPLVLEI